MKEKSQKSTGKSEKIQQAGHGQATRETVESIVIAVILAFLFRGFIAEAFVIPTGSMAPTLQGRHMDVSCPECGYQYRTGASEENDHDRGFVTTTYCPLCRFPLVLDRRGNPNHRSFSGDRILVGKFSYEMSDPERWDVIVFKYPNNAKQNYIKRLIGLPDELVRIQHGDIYAARRLLDWFPERDEELVEGAVPEELRQKFETMGEPLSTEAQWQPVPQSQFPMTVGSQQIDKLWQIRDAERLFLWRVGYDGSAAVYGPLVIQRKPPHKERALLHLVADTDHAAATLERLKWPWRWSELRPEGRWQTSDGKRYRVEAPEQQWAWLGYRHMLPTTYEWELMVHSGRLPDAMARQDGELITDYYAYNDRELSQRGDRSRSGLHWVGDLAVECTVELAAAQGQLALRLVEGGHLFDCILDVATGQATLQASAPIVFEDERGRPTGQPTAQTSVRGPGTYRLRFSNVDNQLRLWVDGKLVPFTRPTTYRAPADVRPFWSVDEPGDLVPARIGGRGLVAEVSRIRIWRDVYYLAMAHYSNMEYSIPVSEQEVQELFRSPQRWATTTLFAARPTLELVVPADAFLPLGDNSPQSLDGRMWGSLPYLERDLLIGEALLVYFPHAWRGPFFPLFWPNFSRMGLIH